MLLKAALTIEYVRVGFFLQIWECVFLEGVTVQPGGLDEG